MSMSVSGPPWVVSINDGKRRAQAARLGNISDSLNELTAYLTCANSSANTRSNGDGTWDIDTTSAVTPSMQVGDTIKINQGPAGLNTRSAVIEAVLSGAFNGLRVRPDTSLSLPVTGTQPLIYYNYRGNTGSGGWGNFLEMLTDGAVTFTVDAGIGGADSEQLATIVGRDLLAYASQLDGLVACMFMNDIYARGWSLARIQASAQVILPLLAGTGLPWQLVGPPPRGNATGGWSTGARSIHMQLDAWLAQYVPTLRNGEYRSPFMASRGARTYLDPSNATGNPYITEASTDGVHCNTGGGLLLANLASPWAIDKFGKVDVLPRSIFDTANGMITTNPFMSGTGGDVATPGAGAVSGTLPDNTRATVQSGATITVACSVVASDETVHGDSIGNAARLLITSGASGGIVEFLLGSSSGTGTAGLQMSSLVTNGDYLQGIAHVTATNSDTPGSGTPVALQVISNTVLMQTSVTGNKRADSHGQGGSTVNQPAYRGVVRTKRTQVRTPSSTHGAPSSVQNSIWIAIGPNAKVCVDIRRGGTFKG